jgi:hypothetical protein
MRASVRSGIFLWIACALSALSAGCASAPEVEPPPRPVLDPVAMPGDSPSSAGPSCERTDGSLAAGATLADHVGAYRLTLVRGDVEAVPSWVEGELTLTERPAGMRSVDGWTTPLQGTAEIEIRRVGAQDTGSLMSDDPAAPGVLVLEDGGAEPTILLRLGSSANRTDLTAFDAAYTVLTVRGIDGGSFAGSWRSGAFGDEVSGYFCAVPQEG